MHLDATASGSGIQNPSAEARGAVRWRGRTGDFVVSREVDSVCRACGMP